MIVRRETAADVEGIRAVIGAAFARPESPGETPPEVNLVDELRDSDAWLPTLSLVATGPDDEVIGHVLCTRGWVDTAAVLFPARILPRWIDPLRTWEGTSPRMLSQRVWQIDAKCSLLTQSDIPTR